MATKVVLDQFKVLGVVGDWFVEALVGVKVVDLSHGFGYHRFSATT